MLKYVTRRFKDTYEKGCNILYARKTWTCSEKETSYGVDKYEAPVPEHNQEPRDSHEHNQNKFDTEIYHHSWIEAIKWSSALVIGWYASQLAYYKFHLKKGRHNGCRFVDIHKYSLNCNIVNRIAFEQNIQQRRSFHVYNVGYDVYEKSSVEELPKNNCEHIISLEEASVHLEKTVGQIENKLGVSSIKNGDFMSGVMQLKSGAHHGNAAANFNLGLCHELGVGVNKNFVNAVTYYEQAAKLGHKDAMYNLGVYYIQGRPGIPIDSKKAKKYFQEAALRGHEGAVRVLKLDSTGFIKLHKQIIDKPQKTKGI